VSTPSEDEEIRDLAKGRNLDWSDTWTQEDLADAQRASISSFDEREIGLTPTDITGI